MMKFFCEYCGNKVSSNAVMCPKCASFFSNVRCPKCNYHASAESFYYGCPQCEYAKIERGLKYGELGLSDVPDVPINQQKNFDISFIMPEISLFVSLVGAVVLYFILR